MPPTLHSEIYSTNRSMAQPWDPPVSVVIADLVMEDVEHRALRTYPNPPTFWKRYVDDTCCILRSDLVDDFHNHLDTIEATIQFTFEREAESQLPILDIFILRNPDKSIDTTF